MLGGALISHSHHNSLCIFISLFVLSFGWLILFPGPSCVCVSCYILLHCTFPVRQSWLCRFGSIQGRTSQQKSKFLRKAFLVWLTLIRWRQQSFVSVPKSKISLKTTHSKKYIFMGFVWHTITWFLRVIILTENTDKVFPHYLLIF